MPTTPSFVSIGKLVRIVRFFLRTVSSVSSIAVWKPITGSVTATDANVLQDRPGAGPCFFSSVTPWPPENATSFYIDTRILNC